MSNWNTEIIEEFRSSGGAVGGGFAGKPLLLLHHKGARSGTDRVVPLMYLQNGEAVYIFASKAGAPSHPDWYHNLKANPSTKIEIGSEIRAVDATEVTGPERDEIYDRQAAAFPQFGEYQKDNPRTIPVFKLA